MSKHEFRISRAHGFTLIEVMTAVVVFSIGLIGLGLLLTSAVRSNQVGFQHTQASFLAEAILDRMRTNVRGIWAGSYNGTFSSATGTPTNQCTNATPCRSAELAQRDTWAWGRMIGNMLPDGSGTVLCTRTAGVPTPTTSQLQSVPVYDGMCTITVAWTEKTEGNDAGGVTQQFQWVVQP